MRKQFTLALALAMLMSCISVWAQGQSLTGKVTDGAGNPLPGVSVLVKGTNRGATSAADGTYKIDVPANAKVIFSYEGLSRKEETPGSR